MNRSVFIFAALSAFAGLHAQAGITPQAIVFAPVSPHVYGDTSFAITPTASSGLPVTLSVVSGPATVSGNTVTLNGAGTVVLQASQAGDTTYAAAPNLTQTFVVAKATASVTIGNLGQAFDGNPKSVTVATVPEGLAVNVTYAGLTAVPSAAGTYAVVATVNDPNYVGTAAGVLTIGPGAQSVSFGAAPIPDHTFGDAPFTVSPTASSGLPVTVSVVSGPATVLGTTVTLTGAGTVTLQASQAGDTNHVATSVTETFSVAKVVTPVVLSGLSQSFDGTAKSVSAVSTPPGLPVSVTYNGSSTPPSAAGSYAVVATVNDSNYQGLASGTLTIGPGAQSVGFGPAPITDHIFGDAPFTLSPASSSGLPVTLSVASGPATVSGNIVTLNGAGTVVLQVSQAGSASFLPTTLTESFSVAKAPAVVVLASLSPAYDGAPKAATAVTVPPGLNVDFSYNGSLIEPSAAGVYTVLAVIDDPNYQGLATGVLAIGPGAQSVGFGSVPIADRTFGDPSFTVSPTASSGLPVTLSVASGPATVSGNTVTLTGAGTVVLQASQAGDANHLATSVTQSFSVAKAVAPVVLSGLAQAADGSPKSVTAATMPAGLAVSVTYNGSSTPPSAAGSYAIVASVSDSNYQGLATGTLTLGAGAQSISFGSGSITDHAFGDAPFTVAPTASSGLPVILSVVSGPATISGNTVTLTGAGTVVLQASQAGNSVFSPSTVTQQFSVSKAPATIILGSLAQSFDGTAKSVAVATVPPGLNVDVSYNGSVTAPSASGTYAVLATIDDPNYVGSAAAALTIGTGGQSVSFGATAIPDHVFGDSPFTVTPTSSSGLPVTLSVASGPAMVTGNTVTLTGAGTVVLQASQAGDTNHVATNLTETFTVAKAVAPLVLGNLAQAFDSMAKNASATTTPPGLAVAMTYNGGATPPSSAGSYAVVATITDPNYQGVATGTLTIGSGGQSVSLGSTAISDHVFGDAPFTLAPTSSSGLPVTLSVASGPASVSGNTVTLTGAGTVVLQASQAGNASFLPTTVTESFSVAKAPAVITLGGLAQAFDGSAKTATATTSPSGLAVGLTYNGSATPPSAPGTYAVLATIIDPNYVGSAGGTLDIGSGTQTVAFTPIASATFGDPPFAVNSTSTSGLQVVLSVVSGPASVSGNTVTLTGAGTVVLQASQAGNAVYQAAPSLTQTLTVAKAAAQVTLGHLAQAFDGTAKSAAAMTSPAGLAVSLTYNGSATPPSAAGSYAVVATVADSNYVGTASGVFEIGPGAQSVSFGSTPITDHVFGDASFTLAPTSSSGLPVALSVVSGPATVFGSTVTLTGAGTVVLKISQAGDSAHLPTNVTESFSIAKAVAPIVLGNLAQTFDGTAKIPAATTSPAGLGVSLTYNGSAAPPSAAGSYAVVATITDANYQGLASGTLTIGPGAQSVSLGSGSLSDRVFGDAPFTLAPTSSSGLPVALSVASGPASISGNTVTLTGAGTVVLQASQAGNGVYLPTAITQEFSVAKAPATLALGNLSQVYDGTAKSASATTNPAGLDVTFTYDGAAVRPSAPGTYAVVAMVNDPNYQGLASGALTIQGGSQSITFASITNHAVGDPSFTVAPTSSSGLPVTLSVVSGPATVSGNTVILTGAGTVILQASQAGNANFGPVSALQSFSVGVGAQSIAFAPLPGHAFGDPPFTVAPTSSSGLPVTLSVVSGPATISGNTVTITGTGTVVLQASQAGNGAYQAATSLTQTFAVAKAAAEVTLGNLAQAFDGTAKNAAATTVPAGLTVTLTYNGGSTAPSAAGSYAVVATVNDPNYQGTASGTLAIGPGAQSVSFGAVPIPNHVFGDPPFTVTPAASSGLPVALSVVGGPATISGNTVTLTGAGTVVLKASQTGDASHLATSVTESFSVAKALAPVSLGNLAQIHDGTVKRATAATTPPGLAVTLSYNGSSTPPSAAGSYTVVATVTDSDYEGLASGTLTIGPGAQSVSLGSGPLPDRVFGDPPFTVSPISTSGLPVTLSVASGPAVVSGTTVILTGAGTVTLAATQPGNGSWIPTTITQDFSVAKAPAMITLGNLTPAFDGSAKTATVTTSPAGLAVAVTYNGSSMAPSATGSYPVVATVTDSNYEGSTGGTLTIGPGGQTLSFGSIASHTLGDAPFAVSATASSGLPVTLSVIDGPATISGSTVTLTGVGDIVLQASQAGNSSFLPTTLTQSFTVGAAVQSISLVATSPHRFGDAPFTISAGSGLPLTVTILSGPATVSGNTVTLTGAGTVVLQVTQAGSGTIPPSVVTQTFDVAKAPASVSLGGLVQAYDGAPKSATATTSPVGLAVILTYNGAAATPSAPGAYTVLATINNANYQGLVQGTLTIQGGAESIVFPPIADHTFGDPPFAVSPSASSGLPVTITVVDGPAIVSGNIVTLTGSGTVVLEASHPGNGGFEPAYVTQSFTVRQPAISVTLSGSRIVNFSGRANVDSGHSLVLGFVASGGSHSVLIRGVGPTLAPFGLAPVLASPKLVLYGSAGTLASSSGWQAASNAVQLGNAAAQIGAFPLQTATDSALFATLIPGMYTAQVTSATGASGLALAEIYETDASASGRLINTSAEGRVGTGSSILVAGFIIAGNAPKTLLLRAVGPTLSQFGIGDLLANPRLDLYSGSSFIASNAVWGSSTNASQFSATAAQIGAFPLAAGSADSVLLVTLQPGIYTVDVSGVGNTTGVALLEIYDVR